MREDTYQVFGDSSPLVASIVDAVYLNDTSDPLNVQPKAFDWFQDGHYTEDGEALDGSNDSDNNPRPSLKFYEYRGEENGVPTGFATITLNGTDTLADGVAFRASATQHTAAILIAGCPRTKNTAFEGAVVFQMPGGRPVIEKFKESIE